MEKNILIKLVEENLSQREIADKLNCSQTTVKYWLKKFELKTKFNLYNKGATPAIKKDYKICPMCKKEKNLDEFYVRYGRRGSGGYCKKCSNQYHSKRVKRVKLKMIEYKGGKCEGCGLKLEDTHYAVFHFHHLDPSKKDPNFTKIKFQKWDYIKKEIDKCALLCSNCHIMEHARINEW